MTDIQANITEALRDALVAYTTENKSLPLVVTAEDLDDYQQIDNQSNYSVKTSRCSQGIEILQRYIDSIYMKVIKGNYTLDEHKKSHWNSTDKSFNLWSSELEKMYLHTENFINPTLRNNKTKFFEDFENQISQGPMNNDTIQEASLAYLNQFEKISNLDIISGYLESKDFPGSRCFFIAKENHLSNYYWRLFDLKDFDITKPQNINPLQWSEWKKIETAIPEKLINIRPVFYNNRLYVVWAEWEEKRENNKQDKTGVLDITGKTSIQKVLKVKLTYKKYNDEWSPPLTIVDYDGRDLDTNTNSFFNLITAEVAAALSPTHGKDISFLNITASTHTANHTDEDFIDIVVWGKLHSWTDEPSYSDGNDSTGNDVFPAPKTIPLIHVQYSLDVERKPEYFYSFHVTNLTYKSQNEKKDENAIFHTYKMIDDTSTKITEIRDHFKQNIGHGNIENPILFPFYDELGYELSSLTATGAKFSEIATNTDKNTNYIYEFLKIPQVSYKKVKDDEYCIKFNVSKMDISTHPDFLVALKRSFGQTFQMNPMNLKVKETTSGLEFKHTNTSTEVKITTNKTPKNFTLDFVQEFEILVARPPTVENPTVFTNQGLSAVLGGMGFSSMNGGFGRGMARTLSPMSNKAPIDPREEAFSITKISINFIMKIKTPELPNFEISLNKVENINFVLFNKGNENLRMIINSTFVNSLVRNASLSLDKLFDSQMDSQFHFNLSEVMANSIYLWELFFHIPFLIAWRFNQTGYYKEAENWLQYIFNPYKNTNPNDTHKDKYWNTVFLKDNYKSNYETAHQAAPNDPDAVAYSNHQIYKKSIFMMYVKNLIDWGDSLYRRPSRDTLVEAKLLYKKALKLLGNKPLIPYQEWNAKKLKDLFAGFTSSDSNIYNFEKDYLTKLPANNLKLLAFVPSEFSNLNKIITHPDFKKPVNKKLLGLWEILEFRFYCLRNSLTIDGKPMHLPLYSANTGLSSSYFQKYGSLEYAGSRPTPPIPHYRFRAILPRASYAVDILTRFGDLVLSFNVQKENSQFEENQREQMIELSNFSTALQQKSLEIAENGLEALQLSQTSAQNRYNHYNNLCNNGISDKEKTSIAFSIMSQALNIPTGLFNTAFAASQIPPNIFGTSVGGAKIGALLKNNALAFELGARVFEIISMTTDKYANFERRAEEWEFQRQLTKDEQDQIEKQIVSQQKQIEATKIAIEQQKMSQMQMQKNYEYMVSRFTGTKLHNWLATQISVIYAQAFDAVVSLCYDAQRCWQYEMVDFERNFFPDTIFDDTRKGLLSGERLKLCLLNMENEYLQKNKRRLEITKTISLKKISTKNDQDPKRNYFQNLKNNGTCEFEFTKELFDNDYPDHYQRQIIFIGVTIPAVIDTYDNICATLTQISSTIYRNSKDDDPLRNYNAAQQIALSSGMDDTGMFSLSFGDERYLPFEGTGAISQWNLTFPKYEEKSDNKQKKILNSLTDVIFTVRYTAIH